MNFKIKFGDLKIKYDNLDFNSFFKAYEKMPQMMFNYYSEFGRAYERYTSLSKSRMPNFEDREDVFPASGHDTYNYVARYGLANFQGQAIMKLDGLLDYKKLAEAVRLSVDAEPVFGCRYVENDPPYWKRISNLDRMKFCSLVYTDDVDSAVRRFLESPLDMDKDPMVKLKVFRTILDDTLCIKINHACSDATGIKEYVQLLSEIYSTIVKKDGTYVPQPRKPSRKDQDRLMETLGIKDADSAFVAGSDVNTPTWPFPWKHGSSCRTCVEVCQLPKGQLEKMKELAHSSGATVNDVILTAFYRAMFSMGLTEYGVPMEIPVTVDLRRYLPDKKTESIRNFSGSLNTKLPMLENEAFGDTLSRVAAVMNDIKAGTPGLQSALGLERLEKTSYREILAYYQVGLQFLKRSSECNSYSGDKCVPTLSNLGYFSNSLVKFGECTVTDAFIVPPVVAAPGFLLMVGTYNDIVTLAGGFYEAQAGREDISKILGKIRDELVEGCILAEKQENEEFVLNI